MGNKMEQWATLDSGLTVPKKYTGLSSENQELLNLREKLDVESLKTFINKAYTDLSVYTDGEGIARAKPGVSLEDLTEGIMKEANYHVHGRHFKNMLEKMEELAGFKDFNGDKYTELVVKAITNLDKESIKEAFEDNTINAQNVFGFSQQVGSNYLGLSAGKFLDSKYKDDVNGLRANLRNLSDIFDLNIEGDKLNKYGLQELTKLGVQSLGTAWQKIGEVKKEYN